MPVTKTLNSGEESCWEEGGMGGRGLGMCVFLFFFLGGGDLLRSLSGNTHTMDASRFHISLLLER